METPKHLCTRSGPLRQRRSRERVAHILCAARRIISDEGGSGLTISGLAAEAGITPASVYRYFPDRAAVLRCLGEQASAKVMSHFRAAVSGYAQGYSGLEGLFSKVLEDLHALYRSDPVLRDIWVAVLAEPELNDILTQHAETQLAILTDAALNEEGPIKGRSRRKEDLALCIEFAHCATQAALDLPALQSNKAIERAKGWIGPMLSASN